jgi:hypothetical protein
MHAMFNRSKQFIVIVAGAAALTFGPAASIAQAVDNTDNTGPVKDGETRADGSQCQNYKNWYDGDVKAGNTKDATYDKNLAAGRGCKWAQARVAGSGHWGDVQYQDGGMVASDEGAGGPDGGGASDPTAGETPPESAGVDGGTQADDASGQPQGSATGDAATASTDGTSTAKPKTVAKHKKKPHRRHNHRKHPHKRRA